MIKLKILDTDKFFYDSPDAGDVNCVCSRCASFIKEGEVPLRVAIGCEDITTGNGDSVDTCANGSEFRLCENCFKKL